MQRRLEGRRTCGASWLSSSGYFRWGSFMWVPQASSIIGEGARAASTACSWQPAWTQASPTQQLLPPPMPGSHRQRPHPGTLHCPLLTPFLPCHGVPEGRFLKNHHLSKRRVFNSSCGEGGKDMAATSLPLPISPVTELAVDGLPSSTHKLDIHHS